MEPEKIEYAISHLMGQMHAFFITSQMLINAHPRPKELLSQWDEIHQGGLATLGAQPISDVGVHAYEHVMRAMRKSLEAAAENRS